MQIEPFHIAVPDADIDDLHRRIRATRWAPATPSPAWQQGIDPAWLREFVDYWANQFDWRAAEQRLNRQPQFIAHVSQTGTEDLIRVLGMGDGGDGWEMWNGDTVAMVPRPESLRGVLNAFAVYVQGDSMEPRYYAGELLYVHPGKPVTPGSFVLVQMHPQKEGEGPRAMVKRLKRRGPTRTTLEQFNPQKTFELKNSEIKTIDRIVGSGEA